MTKTEDMTETYSTEELTEDTRYLAETLEDAHPDPYIGHGGRTHFHRRVEEVIRDIPQGGESAAEFYPRVAELAAQVRDGHTDISPPAVADSDTNNRFPLDFLVVGSELYIDAVYDDALEDLLGGRLVSVEEISVPELVERMSHLKGADNCFQDRYHLAMALRDGTPLRHLLGEPVRTPTVSVELADDSTVIETLYPVSAEESSDPIEPIDEIETNTQFPETNGEPAYRFLDTEESTMLLVLPNMYSYREAIEALRSIGHERGKEIARQSHEELLKGPVPDDYDEVVAELPSAVDILTEMVEAMAAAETEQLVIDTRHNTGGNSLLSNALTYFLYGWDGIEKGGENHIQIPKDSSLYRERIGEDGPIGETENPAGFDFGAYFDRNDTAKRLNRIRNFLTGSSTFAAELESGEYEAFYCPDSVVVVTSATTYSAGAEPAFTFSKLGATVVGVPPSQAPNVPRDMLKDQLPNTGLEVKTSYRHVESLPNVSGRVFQPDVELTPEIFEKMGRPADAGIELALNPSGYS